LDEIGIWAQVVYPNVGGFGNQSFLTMTDDELRMACVRAYNDWLIEWCSVDRRRFIPIMATPFWDIEQSVTEIERCADLGHQGILFTGEPQRFGMPYFADRQWDPLWAAAQDTGLPISFHLGSGDMFGQFRPEIVTAYGFGGTSARSAVTLYLGNAVQIGDFVLAGILPRFPGLKMVAVESGAGWAPFLLQTMDRHFIEFNVREHFPQYTDLPSEYFRRQVMLCHFYEMLAPDVMREFADNLMFETDFPHPNGFHDADAVWRAIHETLEPHDEPILRKVSFSNAAALYSVPEPA
jgi:predicted TIM-barrel fold metal-dependent hydrolase